MIILALSILGHVLASGGVTGGGSRTFPMVYCESFQDESENDKIYILNVWKPSDLDYFAKLGSFMIVNGTKLHRKPTFRRDYPLTTFLSLPRSDGGQSLRIETGNKDWTHFAVVNFEELSEEDKKRFSNMSEDDRQRKTYSALIGFSETRVFRGGCQFFR